MAFMGGQEKFKGENIFCIILYYAYVFGGEVSLIGVRERQFSSLKNSGGTYYLASRGGAEKFRGTL